MKIFFIWLLVMHEPSTWTIATAFVHREDCEKAATGLNESVGANRGMHWECEKQGVER